MRTIFLLLTLFTVSLFAQEIPGKANNIPFSSNMESPAKPYQAHKWYMAKVSADAFVYSTTSYTFGDMVVFSYFDDSFFKLKDMSGTVLDSVYLNRDELYTFKPGQGNYTMESNNSFTLLIGDPVTKSVLGFFAVDQAGSPLSTHLNTYIPKASYAASEHFILFSYYDNTEFVIKSLTDTTIIAAGILNKGEHFTLDGHPGTFINISSGKPVSALSYADQGYYIPAKNGTFAGNEFYGFMGNVGGWTNGITIMGYSDSTNYTILNSETGDTVKQGFVKYGEAATHSQHTELYFTVLADQKVTVSNTPYTYSSTSYYYLTRQIDETGTGLGTHFLIPSISGNLNFTSFADGNEITVYDLTNQDTVYHGVLNNKEFHSLTPKKTLYKITSTHNINVISAYGGGYGADFVPLSYAAGLADIAISSDGIKYLPENVEERVVGKELTIQATVNNYGFKTAKDISVTFFDGNPNGQFQLGAAVQVDSIPPGAFKVVEKLWEIPESPEHRAIYVSLDHLGMTIESNESNNIASKPIIPNKDLLPPLTTVIEAPSHIYYSAKDDSLSFDTFTVSAKIFNTGTVEADTAKASIELPSGLILEADSLREIEIGQIEPQNATMVQWKVMLDSASNILNSDQTALFYSILVGAENAEQKTIKRMLVITRPNSVTKDISTYAQTPNGFKLNPNYPNPFNPSTTISYYLPQNGRVLVEVYDINGRKVKTVVNGNMNAGNHTVQFDGSELSSGLFFIRLNVDGKDINVRKMTLIK